MSITEFKLPVPCVKPRPDWWFVKVYGLPMGFTTAALESLGYLPPVNDVTDDVLF
jgi:hypothetical protein